MTFLIKSSILLTRLTLMKLYSRTYVVLPIYFLMNVFIALRETRFLFFFCCFVFCLFVLFFCFLFFFLLFFFFCFFFLFFFVLFCFVCFVCFFCFFVVFLECFYNYLSRVKTAGVNQDYIRLTCFTPSFFIQILGRNVCRL